MGSPPCAHAAGLTNGRCRVCGAAGAEVTVATGMVSIDTTGLPPGASFGPTIGIEATGAGADPPATIGSAVTGQMGGDRRTAGTLFVGEAFGPRYHIIKMLGAGGMGAVYQAFDAELGVAVALKVIHRDPRIGTVSRDSERRFKTELLLARQVTHKNVVRIHDLGEIDSIKYITMPYIKGDDLGVVLRREGKLPVSRALRLARQIARGLQAAHEAGVIHRDLKPANIMISAGTDDEQALIMDFGISASTSENTAGVIAGTLEYMAPEQATGQPADARADVYAFGLILYEMLTGPRAPARTGEERITAMEQRLAAGLPPLRTVDDTVAEPLGNVVMRCLERDAQQRYATATELCAALAALDDAGELVPEPRRLTRRQLAAAVTAMVAMLSGTYYFARPTPPIQHEPVPVLIADFENRSGDPVFDATVEQSLGLALEQASYITVFRTRDARAIARRLAPDKSDRITEEIGQLIARREGLKVLVAGAIDKTGDGYRLELRATDPATGQPIATAGRNVRDTNQVLAAIDLMAKDVRVALGESKTEMAKVVAAETVTAGSLPAIRAYVRAQDLSRANKIPEALEAYQEAVTLDPQFGRAYAGMASIYSNYFKQPDKADANYQLAMKHLDRMTDREKYRTLGTYYLNVVRNYEKAVETYETLVRLFPADDVGHGNLALAYLLVGNVPRAVEQVRRALAIYPRNALQRYNYVMYSMYAGDFATAIAEATKLLEENPSFEVPLLPLALSRIVQGDVDGGNDAYSKLEASGAQGASLASLGRADLEMYFGRHRAAVALLRTGIAADRKAGNLAAVAHKDIALAEAYLALGDTERAAAAANEALQLSRRESTMFPAAVVLLHTGRYEAAADQTARELDNMLQRQTTAYARLIRGQIAAKRGQFAEAIEAFRDAQKRHDSWFGRYLLGKLYVESNHFAEAIAELELSVKRRGETTDVFFYDMPTLRYLPPAYYWLARAQEGLGGTAEAQKNYTLFLSLRQEADPADPLVVDARRRVSLH